jgi:site-specific recombinase XerD
MSLPERFGAHLRARGLDAVTIHKHLGDVEHFLGWLRDVHQKGVEEVQVVDAQAYIQYLQTPSHELRPKRFGPYSPTTIRRKVGILRQFYDFIHEEIKQC